MQNPTIRISDYDYPLPDERIAKYPLERRDGSKLLVFRNGSIGEKHFRDLEEVLPPQSLLVFNNTKVIRARIILHKPSGARIEVFCLEPCEPAGYERAFAARGTCRWHCIVGNLKKWKEGPLEIPFTWREAPVHLRAWREAGAGQAQTVRFEWDADLPFGQLLEHLGTIPIPPYLGRESQEIDNTRYQTVYSRFEGSVAAPTAGLHFSPELLERLRTQGHRFGEVTLHVGAGTFLPVKEEDATLHEMHTEHVEITLQTLQALLDNAGRIVPVGTTSVRTLESLAALGWRVLRHGTPDCGRTVGQWEIYDIPPEAGARETLGALADYLRRNRLEKLKASTQIMIRPGYRFRVADAIITNFHQPKSTLLLLVAALVGDRWRDIYAYALGHGFRFLSYGDSSILFPEHDSRREHPAPAAARPGAAEEGSVPEEHSDHGKYPVSQTDPGTEEHRTPLPRPGKP